jgi:hypothetical protein
VVGPIQGAATNGLTGLTSDGAASADYGALSARTVTSVDAGAWTAGASACHRTARTPRPSGPIAWSSRLRVSRTAPREASPRRSRSPVRWLRPWRRPGRSSPWRPSTTRR